MSKSDDGGPVLLDQPFEPGAFYNNDARHTELVTRDCAIVWYIMRNSDAEAGYCMETGDLVAIRLNGGDWSHVSKKYSASNLAARLAKTEEGT